MAKGKSVTKQGYVHDGTVRTTKRWRQNGSVVHPLCLVHHKSPSAGNYFDYGPMLPTNDLGEANVVDFDVDGIPSYTGNSGNISTPYNYNGGAEEVEKRGHGDHDTTLALFNYLPRDADGWTDYTPPAGDRIIYVDATASNNTSAGPSNNSSDHYTLATLPNVGNFESPGAVNAYRDLDVAYLQLRAGTGDSILFLCGQIHYSETFIDCPGGRNASERIFWSYYNSVGNTVARPIISNDDTTNEKGFSVWGPSYMLFLGLAIIDTWRDPNHADFVSTTTDDGSGNDVFTPDVPAHNCMGFNGGSDILIEDCYFAFGVHLMSGAVNSTTLIIRRNVLVDAYGDGDRSQGIFIPDNFHVLFEENVMDHNGWWQQAAGGFDINGQATAFNHNFYWQNVNNCIIRGNITARSSSIGLKFTANPDDAADELADEKVWDVFVYNNAFIDDELGSDTFGNDIFDVSTRFRNFCWYDNTMHHLGRGQPTDRNLGWIQQFHDWNGGFYSGNLFFAIGDATITSIVSLQIQGRMINTRFDSNTIYNVGNLAGGFSPTAGMIRLERVGTRTLIPTGLRITNNVLQAGGKSGPCIVDHATGADVTYEGQKYFTALTPSTNWFSIDGSQATEAEWVAETGETGYTTTEITFVNTDVTVEDYMTSLSQTATLPAFMAKARELRKGNYDINYTAVGLNSFPRKGLRPA